MMIEVERERERERKAVTDTCKKGDRLTGRTTLG